MPRPALLRLLVCAAFCLGLSTLYAQEDASEGNGQKKKPLEKYAKWGLVIAWDQGLSRPATDGQDNAFTPLIAGSNGLNISLYHNRRLARFFYWQPEVTYAIYNSTANQQRITFLNLTPLQFQLGFHTGWCRPYLFAGAHIDLALSINDPDGTSGTLPDFGDRLTWGYTYGGGIDFLSFLQISYRRRLWMYDFSSLTRTANAVDQAFSVSFFF